MPSGARPPIPPGIARVAISGLYLGHKWASVYYLQLTGSAIVAADLNTLSGDIAAAWNTRYNANLSNNVSITQVAIVYIPSVGNEVNGSWTGSHAGTAGSSDVENAGTCAVINWKISAYYRGGHPRTYLPGLLNANITNGSQIGSGELTNLATASTGFLADNNGFTTTNISGVAMGTLSYAHANTWRNPPIFRPYTGCSIRGVIGSQRRRVLS
jgi:hypothetical protein